MKTRLSLQDLLGILRDLRGSVERYRLINIYDIGPDSFLLKFGEPSAEKVILVIESGVRVHSTRYARDKPVIPGNFTMKLRKHIRGRRLTGIDLIGFDRVLDLTFGSGEAEHHLIVELYDRGNVVLTDGSYTILSLLRGYTLDAAAAPTGGPAGVLDASAPASTTAAITTSSSSSSDSVGASGAATSTLPSSTKIRVAVRTKYALPDMATTVSLLGAVHAGINARLLALILPPRHSSFGGGHGLEQPPSLPPPQETTSAATSGASLVMDPTAPSTPILAAQITAYLTDYIARTLPGMPAKAKKKLRLATALATRGSGLDLLGPALLEHAAVACGLSAKAGVDALFTGPNGGGGGGGGGGGKDGATSLVTRFAAHVRSLPYLLKAIASRPTPTVALLEVAVAQQGLTGGGGVGGAEAAAAAGLSSLLAAVGGSAGGGAAGGGATSPLIPSTPLAVSGNLGPWDAVEAKHRAASRVVSATPSSSAPGAGSEAPLPAPTLTTADAAPTSLLSITVPVAAPPIPTVTSCSGGDAAPATATAAAGVVDDEGGDGAPLTSQVPHALPYRITDVSPFPFAHLVGVEASSLAVVQALASLGSSSSSSSSGGSGGGDFATSMGAGEATAASAAAAAAAAIAVELHWPSSIPPTPTPTPPPCTPPSPPLTWPWMSTFPAWMWPKRPRPVPLPAAPRSARWSASGRGMLQPWCPWVRQRGRHTAWVP